MNWLTLVLSMLPLALNDVPAPSAADAAELTQVVQVIRSADFRGEREELRRLAERLDAVKDPGLAAYREYWRGFAYWRSAINGGNETPLHLIHSPSPPWATGQGPTSTGRSYSSASTASCSRDWRGWAEPVQPDTGIGMPRILL